MTKDFKILDIHKFFMYHFKAYMSEENKMFILDDSYDDSTMKNQTFTTMMNRVLSVTTIDDNESLYNDLINLKSKYENSTFHTLIFNDLMTYYTFNNLDLHCEFKAVMYDILMSINTIKNRDFFRRFTIGSGDVYESINQHLIEILSSLYKNGVDMYVDKLDKAYYTEMALIEKLHLDISNFLDTYEKFDISDKSDLIYNLQCIKSIVEEIQKQQEKFKIISDELETNIDRFINVINEPKSDFINNECIELNNYFNNLKNVDRHSLHLILTDLYVNKLLQIFQILNIKIN